MKALTLLAMAALAATSDLAHAQSSDARSFHLGTELGYGNFIGRDTDGGESGSMAYGLRLGYSFTARFALEAAYIDYGKFGSGEGIACPGSCPPGSPAYRPVSTEARGQSLSGVITWPINERARFRTILGYTQLKARMDQPSLSQRRKGVLLGAGVGAGVTDRVDVSLDWSLSLLAGKDMGTASARHMYGNVSLVSAGIRWRF